MCANYEEANKIIKKYGQEHLLHGYNKLDDDKKQKLINQIMNIDFEELNSLYEKIKKNTKKEEDKIEPIDYIEKSRINENDKKRYIDKGIEAIKKGRLAVVTMAGGQGTRLRT